MKEKLSHRSAATPFDSVRIENIHSFFSLSPSLLLQFPVGAIPGIGGYNGLPCIKMEDGMSSAASLASMKVRLKEEEVALPLGPFLHQT